MQRVYLVPFQDIPSYLLKVTNFYTPHVFAAPLRVTPLEYQPKCLASENQCHWGTMWHCLCDDIQPFWRNFDL